MIKRRPLRSVLLVSGRSERLGDGGSGQIPLNGVRLHVAGFLLLLSVLLPLGTSVEWTEAHAPWKRCGTELSTGEKACRDRSWPQSWPGHHATLPRPWASSHKALQQRLPVSLPALQSGHRPSGRVRDASALPLGLAQPALMRRELLSSRGPQGRSCPAQSSSTGIFPNQHPSPEH